MVVGTAHGEFQYGFICTLTDLPHHPDSAACADVPAETESAKKARIEVHARGIYVQRGMGG